MRWFDMHPPDQDPPLHWYLGSVFNELGEEIDPRLFTAGQPVEFDARMTVEVQVPGQCLGFNFAAFLMPVVHRTVGDLIASVAPNDIQRFPVKIEDLSDEYEILNVVRTRKCVDESRTTHFQKWTTSDFRADLAGEYRSLYGIKVLAESLKGVHLTRIWGSYVELLCSEAIKEILERHSVAGIRYEDVS